MADIIRLTGLTKKFGDFTAVDQVGFTVNAGEVFGFLGPNGAGKTTTISMLCTLLEPTAGEAFVNGFSIRADKDKVRNSIGIVFQDQSLDEELTAFENMDLHGRLYRVPAETRTKKSDELLKLVGLFDRKNDLVKTFSGGMRRRLEIARGLLHEPKILFLDEPTIGLDPQTRNALWEHIGRLNKEKGMTIILTTHYMEEADKLCDHVAIIDHGKIVALDTPGKLKESIGGEVINVETPHAAKLHDLVKGLDWFISDKIHDGFISVNVRNAEKRVAEIVGLGEKNGVQVKSISLHKPTLEDVFLFFTGKSIREEEASGKESMRMRRRVWKP